MIEFDPFGWLARIVPERWLHRFIRFGAVVILAGFLVLRVRQYRDFALKPLWVVETAVYVVLILAFLLRINPQNRSRGLREIIVPLIGSVFPFALLHTSPNTYIVRNHYLLYGIFWWMTINTLLTVWGMWVLRKSFSITVEARTLVTRGPYRWIRHPVYLGEMLTAGAVALWRFSLTNLVIFVLFVLIQLLRARWEEAKLRTTFPEYGAYSSRSWWFL